MALTLDVAEETGMIGSIVSVSEQVVSWLELQVQMDLGQNSCHGGRIFCIR